MCNNQIIELYKKAYESGSCDLRSANKWLKDLRVNMKLIAKNGIIIKVVAV